MVSLSTSVCHILFGNCSFWIKKKISFILSSFLSFTSYKQFITINISCDDQREKKHQKIKFIYENDYFFHSFFCFLRRSLRVKHIEMKIFRPPEEKMIEKKSKQNKWKEHFNKHSWVRKIRFSFFFFPGSLQYFFIFCFFQFSSVCVCFLLFHL